MNKLLKKIDEMDGGERDRLRQVLRERKKEEEAGKMDWMYKQGRPEDEDYLLGRRIDKYVDDAKEKKEAADKDAAGALFSEVIAKRSDLDMQTKMREDPLYAIRRKEEEARRRLLENPIKMKQLQKALQKKAEEEKKRNKKKKKEKKLKKKKHGSDNSDSDVSDDDDLVNKYLAILAHKKQIKQSPQDSTSAKQKQRDSSSDSSDTEQHRSKGESSRSRKKSESDLIEELKKHMNKDSDSEEEVRQPKAYGLLLKSGQERQAAIKKSRSLSKSPKRSRSPRRLQKRSRSPKSRRSRSKSPRRRRSRSPQRSRQRSPLRRRSRSPARRRSRSPARRRSRSPARRRSRSPARRRSPRRSPPKQVQAKKKLTAEEMEKKRQEMMQDAKWRDEQRTSNIVRYRKEAESEKEQLKKQTHNEAAFLNPVLSKHADESSVEDRLKRNRYSLQRTKVQLDKAFTKQ